MCPCICQLVCVFPHSNINISETSGPIAIKFYLKHHWDGGKAAIRFGLDRIRTLVFMATDSSHRVIMGKRCCHFFLVVFDQIFFMLAGNEDMHESSEFKVWPDLTTACGVSCP